LRRAEKGEQVVVSISSKCFEIRADMDGSHEDLASIKLVSGTRNGSAGACYGGLKNDSS
jgi:hypothetical protein